MKRSTRVTAHVWSYVNSMEAIEHIVATCRQDVEGFLWRHKKQNPYTRPPRSGIGEANNDH